MPRAIHSIHTQLTASEYRACWGDNRPKQGEGDVQPGHWPAGQPCEDQASYIVPRAHIPPHAVQPVERGTTADPWLSSRNVQKMDKLQAMIDAERNKRKELEEQLARMQGTSP